MVMKGQSAIESMTLIGFVILFSIPLLFLVTTLNTQGTNIEQAKLSARIMKDAANTVYIQGPGASKVVSIVYPSGLRNLSVVDREIMFEIITEEGMIEIVEITIPKLNSIDSEFIGTPPESFMSGYSDPATSTINAGLRQIRVSYSSDPNDGIKFEMIQ